MRLVKTHDQFQPSILKIEGIGQPTELSKFLAFAALPVMVCSGDFLLFQ